MHLIDALARNRAINAVPLLHEQSVGIAAEAYSQYDGKLGAALVTSGPGGTNAVTAVAAAFVDSTPVVFISGQVKTQDSARNRGVRQFGFQEVDIVSVVKPLTKMARYIGDSRDAAQIIDEALDIASAGRPGPVWLDIPLDVQTQGISTDDESRVEPEFKARANVSVREGLREQLNLLNEDLQASRKPLFLFGNGVRLANSQDLALAIARKAGIPISLTWKALDFLSPEDDLYAGRPGGVATHFANGVIQSCDLLISIGARLDLGQLGYRHDTFAPNARVYIVDVDDAELAKFKFASPTTLIQADAREFLNKLEKTIKPSSLRFTKWREAVANAKHDFSQLFEDDKDWTDGISQYSLIDELSRQMSGGHLLVPGSSGACSEAVMQAFNNKPGQRVFNNQGLGSMGFGIPAAIGACIASKRRPVVCVDGDGGFAMNIQELANVRLNNLPISFFILQNDGYASIRATANNYFAGRQVGCDESSGLGLPDYETIGPAFGIQTNKVNSHADLASGVSHALTTGLPSITVVKVGSKSRTSPRLVTTADSAGQMHTPPLNELTPAISGHDLGELLR